MADQEALDILKQGVETWNTWKEYRIIGAEDICLDNADLREADLRGADFSDTNLRGANLSNADLGGAYLGHIFLSANLKGANLEGVNFDEAYFEDADLSDANLSAASFSKVDFRGANLSHADLSHADLREANFRGADLRGANLSNTDLRGANLNARELSEYAQEFSKWSLREKDDFDEDYLKEYAFETADAREVDFKGADLRGANLSHADLRGANLKTQDLKETNLSNTDLRGANLSNANLSGANLSNANLSGQDLSGTDLSNTQFIGADLSNTNLTKTDMRGANLRAADLSRSLLIETDFTGASLSDCNIYGIAAWNAKIEHTKQESLIITQKHEATITIDNLKVAQFIYLILNNKEIRDVIDTIAKKAVLILGRFTSERKVILDNLKEVLRKDYLPILFDFQRPTSQDLTGTVSTLAYIIVDLTDPSCSPYEIGLIAPCMKPIAPIFQPSEKALDEFSMLKELVHRNHWILPVHHYYSLKDLLVSLQEKVIDPAERKVKELEKK